MRILIAGILAVCAYFLWQYYSSTPKSERPIDRLLLYMDGHVNEILGPLPSGGDDAPSPPSYVHQLRTLREDIKNMQATALPKEEQRYAAAIKLCDVLISASNERDKYIARINDTRTNTKPSPLAADPEQDRAERLAFFEKGVVRSWDETSRRLHKVIDGYRAQLKKYEHPD